MFLCLSCQGINSDTMFLLMWKITACFHAVNTETVSIVWTCHFARKWTRLCMGVSLNDHLPRVFLALKNTSSSLEPSQPSYLAEISLEVHLVHVEHGLISHTELAVKCARHKNECSVCPDHFALISFTFIVVQIHVRLYFGSDGNRCRLTPSLVVLLQPAVTHLDSIIENNKLQTWQKTLGNLFSSNTLHVHVHVHVHVHAVVRCMYMYTTHTCTWAKSCGLRIGNHLSLCHEFYANEKVWACRSAPPQFNFFYGIKREGKNLQMTNLFQ